MESIIKEDIKDSGITIGTLAKEMNISEDRVTAMNNNPEGTPIGRIIAAYDYIGKTPTKLISGISDNKPALDMLELSAEDFLCDRRSIEGIINKYGSSSKPCTNIINAFESNYRYPLIYITGSEACGKTSMAENLLGTELKFTGNSYERGYKTLLLMSEKRSGIEYNYPFGEYPYRIKKSEFMIDLLTRRCVKDEMERCLEPISKIGMQSPFSYVVYSDSPFLKAVNIVCSNPMILSSDDIDGAATAETDAQIIGIADVIVIMLDRAFVNSSTLADIIQYSWHRWNKDMIDHVIFVIARADRYSSEKIDVIRNEYSGIIRDMLKHLTLTPDNSVRERFFEDIPRMIFSYSSIYKKSNYLNSEINKVDAMYNTAFYKRLQSLMSISLDNKRRRDSLAEILYQKNTIFSSKSNMSNDAANNLKTDIKGIFSQAEMVFNSDFSKEYSRIISSESILQLIERYDITRTDKGKLISIINSQLNNAVVRSASRALFKIAAMINEINYNMDDTDLTNSLTSCVMNTNAYIVNNFGCEKDKREFRRAIMQQSNCYDSISAKQKILAGGTLAAGVAAATALSIFTPIIAATAAADVAAYYAQTNFKKNTAKKIVSLYEKHGIKKNLSEKLISEYFVTLENELKGIIDSFSFQGDENALKLTDKILEVISS